MFFKESEWSPDLFNQYIPTSSALGFDKVRSSLVSTDDLFVIPLLGEELRRHGNLSKRAGAFLPLHCRQGGGDRG